MSCLAEAVANSVRRMPSSLAVSCFSAWSERISADRVSSVFLKSACLVRAMSYCADMVANFTWSSKLCAWAVRISVLSVSRSSFIRSSSPHTLLWFRVSCRCCSVTNWNSVLVSCACLSVSVSESDNRSTSAESVELLLCICSSSFWFATVRVSTSVAWVVHWAWRVDIWSSSESSSTFLVAWMSSRSLSWAWVSLTSCLAVWSSSEVVCMISWSSCLAVWSSSVVVCRVSCSSSCAFLRESRSRVSSSTTCSCSLDIRSSSSVLLAWVFNSFSSSLSVVNCTFKLLIILVCSASSVACCTTFRFSIIKLLWDSFNSLALCCLSFSWTNISFLCVVWVCSRVEWSCFTSESKSATWLWRNSSSTFNDWFSRACDSVCFAFVSYSAWFSSCLWAVASSRSFWSSSSSNSSNWLSVLEEWFSWCDLSSSSSSWSFLFASWRSFNSAEEVVNLLSSSTNSLSKATSICSLNFFSSTRCCW